MKPGKLLGLLVPLALAIAMIPGTAFASDDVHYLSFASDRHGNTTAIADAMAGMPAGVEYACLIGDMVGAGGGDAPVFQSSTVRDEVASVLPKAEASILWADHDAGVDDDAKIVFANGEESTSGVMKEGAANKNGKPSYYLYGINFCDMKQASRAAEAAKDFEQWIDTIDESVPVIVLCHVPIHNARGDNTGAGAWNKALNYAATGTETETSGQAVRRNVAFLSGHNHTTESKTGLYSGEFYVPCGSTMAIGPTAGSQSTIYYTYVTAGYLNQNNTATLISITEDKIELDKYCSGVVADGVYDTASSKSGRFASEFATQGENYVTRVRALAGVFPEACKVFYTDYGKGTAEANPSGPTYLRPGPISARVEFTSEKYMLDEFTVKCGDQTVAITQISENEYSFTMPRRDDMSVEVTSKERTPIETAKITGLEKSYVCTGSAITAKISAELDGATLSQNVDYRVSYADNVNVGTATVTVTGIGNYYGSASETFQITPAPIADAQITGVTTKRYTGSAITQSPTVQLGSKTLQLGIDYELVYANNVKVGTATLTVVGVGNYEGSASQTFKITKAKNTLTVKGKTAKVKLSKVKSKAVKIARPKALKVSKAKGTLSFAKASGNKKISINAKSGKITVKKGTKKGTYKVKVKVKAAGNANYSAATKTVTFKVKVV